MKVISLLNNEIKDFKIYKTLVNLVLDKVKQGRILIKKHFNVQKVCLKIKKEFKKKYIVLKVKLFNDMKQWSKKKNNIIIQ